MTRLQYDRNVELDALGVERIEVTMVERHAPSVGMDMSTLEAPFLDGFFEFAHTIHSKRDVDPVKTADASSAAFHQIPNNRGLDVEQRCLVLETPHLEARYKDPSDSDLIEHVNELGG